MATNDPLNLTQSLHCVSTNGDRIYPELIEDTTFCEPPNQSINISELEKNTFDFHPNPTEGAFQIEFNENLNPNELSIQVMNTLGQNIEAHFQVLENRILVELKSATPGVHFILITNEQKTWSKRLVVK
ncbi:MAG: T9SS type A sorting domain-containing protein [Flavobacteriales bacterium]